MFTLQWLNCFWLLIPILAWNVVFSSKLAHPAFEYDKSVHNWILLLENVLRVAVMILPLLMPLHWDTPQAIAGIVVYLIGLLIYFASWLPLMFSPGSIWSNSLPGFLAPAYTPLLWLIGITLIGGWWPYLALSAIFVGVHIGHWWKVYALVLRK